MTRINRKQYFAREIQTDGHRFVGRFGPVAKRAIAKQRRARLSFVRGKISQRKFAHRMERQRLRLQALWNALYP